jgi:hypothetical protein
VSTHSRCKAPCLAAGSPKTPDGCPICNKAAPEETACGFNWDGHAKICGLFDEKSRTRRIAHHSGGGKRPVFDSRSIIVMHASPF